MNNQDQAAEVIRTWQKRHKYAMDYNPDWAAQNLAIDLHQAGLLAPDAPQPYFEYGNGPNWEIPLSDGLRSVIVRSLYGEVNVSERGLGFRANSAEARKIAAATLAAANHAEEA